MPIKSRLVAGGLGRYRRNLFEPAGNLSDAKVLVMPLFVHKGPLTCTGPERGTLLGPSVCAGTGNPLATGSLMGCVVLPPRVLGGSWSLGMVVGLALHVQCG